VVGLDRSRKGARPWLGALVARLLRPGTIRLILCRERAGGPGIDHAELERPVGGPPS